MRSRLLSFAILFFVGLSFVPRHVLAEESTENKVKDAAGDTSTDIKKSGRHLKQKVRKATGNDDVVKDAKDKANDVGDDVSNGVDKAKRKTGPQ